MTPRKPRSTKERARLFKLRGGLCYLCGGAINGTKEAWEVEHRIALSLGGSDEDENLELAHAKCHKVKTAQDATHTAEAKRREARHTGAHVPKATIPAPPRRSREPRRLAEGLPTLPRRELFR